MCPNRKISFKNLKLYRSKLYTVSYNFKYFLLVRENLFPYLATGENHCLFYCCLYILKLAENKVK